MAFIIGAATLAVTAATAYASHQGQRASAKKQNAYAAGRRFTIGGTGSSP